MTEAATGLGASPIPTVAPTAGEVPKFRLGQPVSAGAADLAWSVLPQVAMMLLGHSVSDRSGIAALRERVRNHARSIAPRVGPALTRVGPVLVVDTSVQTERVTAPLIEELENRVVRVVQTIAGGLDLRPELPFAVAEERALQNCGPGFPPDRESSGCVFFNGTTRKAPVDDPIKAPSIMRNQQIGGWYRSRQSENDRPS